MRKESTPPARQDGGLENLAMLITLNSPKDGATNFTVENSVLTIESSSNIDFPKIALVANSNEMVNLVTLHTHTRM